MAVVTHRRDPPSWYAETAGKRDDYPALDNDVAADVCIVGGGYAGLSAALHLAERGIDTVLLEAERVGYGASGRNGGQLHSGQRRDQDWLEEKFGLDMARRLWSAGEDAKALVIDLIARHKIDCDLRFGLIHAAHKPRYVDDERHYMERLIETYGYHKLDWLDRGELAEALGTDVYYAGVRDRGAGHLHPLKFAIGLARAAQKAGARIFEKSPAVAVEQRASPIVRTASGSVRAATVVLAGNGYLDGIDTDLDARVLPLNNYILATDPIGAGRAGGILPGGEAASDSRFVIYYWRPSPDGRLLFGGGETYTREFPADIKRFVHAHLRRIYPALADIPVSHAWGGTLAITVNRLPYVRRIGKATYAAAGFSGQGVAVAPWAGKQIAEAIAGNTGGLDLLARLPCPRLPGGKLLRWPIMAAGMAFHALLDRV